jgi:predicted PurR-regulated permease PerM
MKPIKAGSPGSKSEVTTSQPTPPPQTPPESSPHWGWTAKLVVGLTFVAILAFLVVRFQSILGPLLMAAILVYLLYPLASWLRRRLKIPWRFSVTLIYLVLILVVLGLLTLGGLALFEQIQSLINFLQNALVSLPDFIANLSHQKFTIGPFIVDISKLDLSQISSQALSFVQGFLGQAGSLVGVIASGAAGVAGWVIFILLISYFILVESSGIPSQTVRFPFPGYEADFRRLGKELGRVWNAFLRGQLIVTGLTILLYIIILSAMGVRYGWGLAILAGLAKFIPYVGPFIAWTTYGLVAYFQGWTLFGLQPLPYALIVVGICIVVDNVFDSLVTPRILAQALKVHPAAVLVAALIGANLLGLVGIVLAAPVLATLKLFFEYTVRKLFDLNPWEGLEVKPNQPSPISFVRQAQVAWRWLKERFHRG